MLRFVAINTAAGSPFSRSRAHFLMPGDEILKVHVPLASRKRILFSESCFSSKGSICQRLSH